MIDTTVYRDHLRNLDRMLADSLERAGASGLALDGVLFHSGREENYHRDDEIVPFRPTAHFLRWIPVDGPEHVVLARPGRVPVVVLVRPRDFWFDTSAPKDSFWQSEVDLNEVESFEQVVGATGPLRRIAYVGSCPEAAAQAGIAEDLVEPDALMAPLDWHRAFKTDYEIAQVAAAADKSASGHHRARQAFEAGGSEREIHWAYLEGSDHIEAKIPYPTIVAIDHKAAILHYQNKRGREAAPGNVVLIDAGSQSAGYAADLTRTWAGPGADPVFVTLLHRMDEIERALVAMVTPGRSYVDVHLETHRLLAQLLAETGIVTTGAEEALDRGITRTFLPHGVGHHLGLQVHDVGGRQAGPEGGTVSPPDDHPFLRNTRIQEPGHLLTIEPGLYFIPMLLEPLRAGEHSSAVDWNLVDRLTPFGGIRIEDNVVCTNGEPVDLSRALIPGPRGV